MNSPAPPPIYAIDTNVLMDWQVRYYPTDIFSSLVQTMDTLISANRLFAPALVQEELDSLGSQELSGWAKARKNIFIPTATLLQAALGIQNRFPGLRDPKAQSKKRMPM